MTTTMKDIVIMGFIVLFVMLSITPLVSLFYLSGPAVRASQKQAVQKYLGVVAITLNVVLFLGLWAFFQRAGSSPVLEQVGFVSIVLTAGLNIYFLRSLPESDSGPVSL